MYTFEERVVNDRLSFNYSWRTGRRGSGDVTSGPRYVKTPVESGGFLAQLNSRKNYLEAVDANVGSQVGPRVEPGDTGHSYCKVEMWTQRVPGLLTVVAPDGSVKTENHVWGISPAKVGMHPSARNLVPWTGRVPIFGGTRSGFDQIAGTDQRSVNAGFVNMQPNPSALPIAETLVELMRGDLPGSLRSLQRNLNSVKRLQEAGADYLSVQFAWTPVIKDAIKTIEVLMSLESLVSGSSSFRRRRYLYPTERFSEYSSRALDRLSGKPWDSSVPGLDLWPSKFGKPVKEQYGYRFDHVINAKLLRGARPTRKSNDLFNRGLDMLEFLGFNQPSLGWQLTSFSWLIDWAADIGKSIDNAALFSQSGRYPIDYAYISTKCSSWAFLENTGPSNWTNYGHAYTLQAPKVLAARTFSFSRVPITPFKPGFSLNGLNAFQYSILVALGLAKSR